MKSSNDTSKPTSSTSNPLKQLIQPLQLPTKVVLPSQSQMSPGIFTLKSLENPMKLQMPPKNQPFNTGALAPSNSTSKTSIPKPNPIEHRFPKKLQSQQLSQQQNQLSRKQIQQISPLPIQNENIPISITSNNKQQIKQNSNNTSNNLQSNNLQLIHQKERKENELNKNPSHYQTYFSQSLQGLVGNSIQVPHNELPFVPKFVVNRKTEYQPNSSDKTSELFRQKKEAQKSLTHYSSSEAAINSILTTTVSNRQSSQSIHIENIAQAPFTKLRPDAKMIKSEKNNNNTSHVEFFVFSPKSSQNIKQECNLEQYPQQTILPSMTYYSNDPLLPLKKQMIQKNQLSINNAPDKMNQQLPLTCPNCYCVPQQINFQDALLQNQQERSRIYTMNSNESQTPLTFEEQQQQQYSNLLYQQLKLQQSQNAMNSSSFRKSVSIGQSIRDVQSFSGININQVNVEDGHRISDGSISIPIHSDMINILQQNPDRKSITGGISMGSHNSSTLTQNEQDCSRNSENSEQRQIDLKELIQLRSKVNNLFEENSKLSLQLAVSEKTIYQMELRIKYLERESVALQSQLSQPQSIANTSLIIQADDRFSQFYPNQLNQARGLTKQNDGGDISKKTFPMNSPNCSRIIGTSKIIAEKQLKKCASKKQLHLKSKNNEQIIMIDDGKLESFEVEESYQYKREGDQNLSFHHQLYDRMKIGRFTPTECESSSSTSLSCHLKTNTVRRNSHSNNGNICFDQSNIIESQSENLSIDHKQESSMSNHIISEREQEEDISSKSQYSEQVETIIKRADSAIEQNRFITRSFRDNHEENEIEKK